MVRQQLLAVLGAVQLVATGAQPVDTDCIKWQKVNSGAQESTAGLPLIVGHEMMGENPPDGSKPTCFGPTGHTTDCEISFEQICVTLDGAKDGHRNGPWATGPDVGEEREIGPCWIYDHSQEQDFYLGTYSGTHNLTWSEAKTGQPVPTNVYKIGDIVLARNSGTEKNPRDWVGNIMPGRVPVTGGVLGEAEWDDYGNMKSEDFMIATCHPPTLKPWTCSATTGTCLVDNSTSPVVDNKTTFKTQQDCAAKCIAPPPPPLSKNPCIRFGHTIPVAHHVDVEITQLGSGAPITHQWSNFKFGDFSDWVNVFKPGTGSIKIWENVGGTRGPLLYTLDHIPLTPGPLVVVVKVAASQVANRSGYWPPSLPDAVETIAASYVQSTASSSMRLFNLSPDTKQAGMSCSANGTAEIVSKIDYSLGSDWVTVPSAAATYGFHDDSSGGKSLLTKSETPAPAPLGTTSMLVGLQGGSGLYGIQAIPLQDAPEGGTCHP